MTSSLKVLIESNEEQVVMGMSNWADFKVEYMYCSWMELRAYPYGMEASDCKFDPHVHILFMWPLGHENISMAALPITLIQGYW